MKKSPLESNFVRRVKTDLSKIYAGDGPEVVPYVRKNMAASIGGIPDVEAVIVGLYFGLECKRDKSSKPTPLQLHTIDRIRRSGGFAEVVYPENWDEVYRKIIELCERAKNVSNHLQGTEIGRNTPSNPKADKMLGVPAEGSLQHHADVKSRRSRAARKSKKVG